MARLGDDERNYCQYHGIPIERLFDASGLKRAVYNHIMAEDEKWAAFGVIPCPNGHMLRNRHGSCLMCDSRSVAFMLRSKLSGYLYVATGANRELMKLGFSQDPANRISIANYEGWGGYSDWRIFARCWSSHAGKLEHDFQIHFQDIQVPLSWVRNEKFTHTKEAFRADMPEACSKLVWLCDDAVEILDG